VHLEQRAHPPSFAAGGSCAVSKAPAKSATTRAPSRMWTSDVGRHSLPLLARTLCAHFSAHKTTRSRRPRCSSLLLSPLSSLFSPLSLFLARASFLLLSVLARTHQRTLSVTPLLLSLCSRTHKKHALSSLSFSSLSLRSLCVRACSLPSLTYTHRSRSLSSFRSPCCLQMGGGAQCVRVLFSLTVYCCCFLRMGGGACGVQCVCA
jgi:hypothetical protein